MLSDEQRIRQLLENPDWRPEDRVWLLDHLGVSEDPGERLTDPAPAASDDVRERLTPPETGHSDGLRERLTDPAPAASDDVRERLTPPGTEHSDELRKEVKDAGTGANDSLREQLAALFERDLRSGATIDGAISAKMRERISFRTGVQMRAEGEMPARVEMGTGVNVPAEGDMRTGVDVLAEGEMRTGGEMPAEREKPTEREMPARVEIGTGGDVLAGGDIGTDVDMGADVEMGARGKVRRIGGYWWWAAAAAIVIVSGVYLFRAERGGAIAGRVAAPDALPGGNRAVLTLADGRTIRLDSAAKGELVAQGQTKIIQLDSGMLSYQSGSGAAEALLAYNTITTPRGGQYQVVLSDGTRVWLNAASSLRYPAAFAGDRRVVELTGEAYFEVAPKHQPFSVRVAPGGGVVDTLTIDVLGTHFNVNAYTDEGSQKATLLEGRVRVRKGAFNYILAPGQQAIANQSIRIDRDADLDEAIAWKNGLFIFNNLPLESVMRQVGRWYDMEVVYKGNAKNIVFNGQLSRYANVSRLLELLQTTGEVHFSIENKTIIVRP